MSRKPKPTIISVLRDLVDALARPLEEIAFRKEAEKEYADAKMLERLKLAPLKAATPESDALWEELIDRQRKVMDDILAHPPVGAPYPPFETHITYAEARILGVSDYEPNTLFGYPLVIDYEPK